MNKLADILSSPIIALLLFGPFVLMVLIKGCAEMESGSPSRRG